MRKTIKYDDYLKKTDFDVIVSFRLTPEQVEFVRHTVRNKKDKYENMSHFYRVAVIQLLKQQ